MNLLVTRAEPDGERSAAALRARGHTVVLAPLTRIEPLAVELGAGPWAAVLIGSANAVRGLEIQQHHQRLAKLPLIAVGDRSAEAARAAGFTDVTSVDGTVADLAAFVAARYRGTDTPLLYLAGAERSGELAGMLAGIASVEMYVVYQAVAVEGLPAKAAAALRSGALDGVLHFSRRSAEIYLATATRAGLAAAALAPAQFCLSERIAAVLAAAGAKNIRIAPHPSEKSLLQLIDSA